MTGLRPPKQTLNAIVCIPARNEEVKMAACIEALAQQDEVPAAQYEILLVLHCCTDSTLDEAMGAAARFPDLDLHVLTCNDGNVGKARRLGMNTAWERFAIINQPDGLIASTDADTVVASDWLAQQLALVRAGVLAIGGRIDLDQTEQKLLAQSALDARQAQSKIRMATILGRSDVRVTDHHFFSGASMAVTAATYRKVGGLLPIPALEDEALQRALEEHRVPIVRSNHVRVRTSARTLGRAPRGLARDLSLTDWRARRTFAARDFSVEKLATQRGDSVCVILPAREVAGTIGHIIDELQSLQTANLIDEIVVVDAASKDGTASIAVEHGARVVQQDDVLCEFGPALGKGDCMWRALAATTSDIVCFVDADTSGFSRDFVVGLLGPMIIDPSLSFVKGAFLRPYRTESGLQEGQGGRVTELVARPLLNLYAPQLAGFDQPLAGELSVRRDVLEAIAFPSGYGVEIAMLIDIEKLVGLDSMAQVDLGQRLNRHQPLRELSAMAYAVMVAAGRRLRSDDEAFLAAGPLLLPPVGNGPRTMEPRRVPIEERPAIQELRKSGLGTHNSGSFTLPESASDIWPSG